MNELQIYENEEFGRVRTLLIEGEPWFIGKDVANILGYERATKAIQDRVDVEDRIFLDETQSQIRTEFHYRELGQRGGWIISESGLYCLILASKLPASKKFRRWVTSEILPSIRKYGGYITPTKLEDIFDNPHNLATFLKQMLHLTEENLNLQSTISTLEPKAQYFDSIVDGNLLINFRTTAKEIGIKPMFFIGFLLDRNYLYRDTKQVLNPYQTHVENGLFQMKEYTRHGHAGTQTLITPKGRDDNARVNYTNKKRTLNKIC